MVELIKGAQIQLTKLSSNAGSLCRGYSVKGFLLVDLEVGYQVLMIRFSRRGLRVLGATNTSPVLAIRPLGNGVAVRTESGSLYQIEPINEPPPLTFEEFRGMVGSVADEWVRYSREHFTIWKSAAP